MENLAEKANKIEANLLRPDGALKCQCDHWHLCPTNVRLQLPFQRGFRAGYRGYCIKKHVSLDQGLSGMLLSYQACMQDYGQEKDAR